MSLELKMKPGWKFYEADIVIFLSFFFLIYSNLLGFFFNF